MRAARVAAVFLQHVPLRSATVTGYQPPGGDDEPTVYANYGAPGAGLPSGQGTVDDVEPPWYRKPAALIAWGALVALLLAVIAYGIVALFTGGGANSPNTTPATSSSSTTTTATTTATSATPSTTTTTAAPTTGTTPTTTAPTTGTTTATTPTTTAPGTVQLPTLPSEITLPRLPSVITLPPGL